MNIAKRENALKDAYWKRFEALYPAQHYFVMQHQDVRNSGYPDNSLHGYGHTTWWEFKHATPNFSSPGLQELTCVRLAKHSYCRYVIFFECYDVTRTLIVHPREVHQKKGKLDLVAWEVSFHGHDFDQLAAFMHSIHSAASGPLIIR